MRKAVFFSLTLCMFMGGAMAADGGVESGFFTAPDGVKIHYLVTGSGTPVILIHGYTGTAEGNWFLNGIADALKPNHRVVAIDCRGHGESDKPHDEASYGAWMWQDVIGLMNHLGIEKAHIHGYSMGGSIVTQLLTHYPNRIISAAYGGSGIREVDPEWKAKVPADKSGTDPKEAEARNTLRTGIPHDQEALTAVRNTAPWLGPESGMIDLTALDIPVLAINGEFDRPIAKTHRMERELKNFTSVVLPGKSHLTAIMSGYMPKLYIDSLVTFINSHDPGHE